MGPVPVTAAPASRARKSRIEVLPSAPPPPALPRVVVRVGVGFVCVVMAGLGVPGLVCLSVDSLGFEATNHIMVVAGRGAERLAAVCKGVLRRVGAQIRVCGG